jgi:hypothetical protein
MLGAGISPELVAQATGLALEQVLTLAPSDIGSNGHRVDEGQQG